MCLLLLPCDSASMRLLMRVMVAGPWQLCCLGASCDVHWGPRFLWSGLKARLLMCVQPDVVSGSSLCMGLLGCGMVGGRSAIAPLDGALPDAHLGTGKVVACGHWF